jgi:DNA topoisomerase I
MGKSLVIVESPAKAKTINKYLGKQFIVKSSVGHIRDLPSSGGGKSTSTPKERAAQAAKTRKMSPEKKAAYKKERAQTQLVARMGIDPGNNWTANYETMTGKEKVINELKARAKDAEAIYLATDLDREGEAIAWHLREVIGGDENRYHRVVFNEITKSAIAEAFSKPATLDMNHVNAQQARRFLDRVVGYMVSPLLWSKIARGLSAGRVQSVAVRLIVEREKEIRAFIPEEYWDIHANLTPQATPPGTSPPIPFKVTKQTQKAFRPVNEALTSSAVEKLRGATYNVIKRDDNPTKVRPKAPFITSTLQQAASIKLGFGVKKTMTLAQRLYESGYITYMRTDSTNLSQEAISTVRSFIEQQYGNPYLPPAPIVYTSKKGAQEAHEAIRPSDVNVSQSQITGLDRDASRLYGLIWRQFIACQMTPAQYIATTILVEADEFILRTQGRIQKFDGFTKVQPANGGKDEDVTLPDLKVGDACTLAELTPSQHFTKPAPRFSEAALVRELEKRGIGRPSTYASIVSTIQTRGYVTVKNKRFYAEKIGDIVTSRLMENFDDLMDYGFTASMEETLDNIASGKANWKTVLDEFYAGFARKLERADDKETGMRPNAPTETGIACADCGRKMQIRTGSTGVFLGCSGYALPPKERCKATVNLVPGAEITAEDDDDGESRILRSKRRCPKCGTAMESYLIDETRKLHVCGNNPDCTGFDIESGKFHIKGYDGPLIECEKCGSDMQLRSGRFGKYFACTGEDCKNTRKLLKNGQPAPPRADPIPMPNLLCTKVDDHYVLRDGAAGIFLAASKYPKNRETRAPLVEELIPVKDKLDPKLRYLADAPIADPDGLKAVIRYSRKTKQQYVMTENNKKPTGWRAVYEDGAWKEIAKKKAAS